VSVVRLILDEVQYLNEYGSYVAPGDGTGLDPWWSFTAYGDGILGPAFGDGPGYGDGDGDDEDVREEYQT